MKCSKCGKKIIFPQRILDRIIYNPTTMCDDCFHQEQQTKKTAKPSRNEKHLTGLDESFKQTEVDK